MAEISTYNTGLDTPEYKIAKYSYSNLTDEILGKLFKNSSNAGARLRQPMISSESFVVGAFDIGWEGYSFDGVNDIVSTGHLLKLINDKIEKISGGSQESITEHANKKATSTVLGHTYITDSITLTSITEANRSYTAASVKALDTLHTTIASEYKQYISETVLGGEVTDKSLDTIKELSEWITSHGEEAADLVSQFNTHEKLQATTSVLGHTYFVSTEDDFDAISSDIEKTKKASISAYFVGKAFSELADSVAQSVAGVKQEAYTYAGQVATTAQNNAYTYAGQVAEKAKQDAYSYADSVANKIVEVALSWQII